MAIYPRLDCGHEDQSEGFEVCLKSLSEDKKVLYFTVCASCDKKYKEEGRTLASEEEVMLYLSTE